MLETGAIDCAQLSSFRISVVHEFGKGPSMNQLVGNDVVLHTRKIHNVADVPMEHLLKCPILKDGIQKLLNENKESTTFEIRITGNKTLLTQEGIWSCINNLKDVLLFDAESLPTSVLLSVFASSRVLHLPEISKACEVQISKSISWASVGIALYAANIYKSQPILEAVFFFFRNAIIQGHVSPSWLLDALPTSAQAIAANVARAAVQFGHDLTAEAEEELSIEEKLKRDKEKAVSSWLELPGQRLRLCLEKGLVDHKGLATPLKVLQDAADAWILRSRLLVKPVPFFTLMKLKRKRGDSGRYPHVYSIVKEETGEVIARVVRESEGGDVSVYGGSNDYDCQVVRNLMSGLGAYSGGFNEYSNAIDETLEPHGPLYRGKVVHQYLGTVFKAYDCGSEPWMLEDPLAKSGLPGMQPRNKLAEITYEPNVVGDCPRKIFVDLKGMDGNTLMHLDNVQPRWDFKIGSFALPFFGRVLKASAKNFQLKDASLPSDGKEEIFLMFGKVSKDEFALDFREPISPLAAISIAVAAMTKKTAVA
eukprot:GDKJ01032001.1.p1 GENE.GDKJ01032001.1~~GDKJ01032001.1.p1  ORF type:complete len:536 (+),score=81.13 GDKJ01032001.1:37-1644(+)